MMPGHQQVLEGNVIVGRPAAWQEGWTDFICKLSYKGLIEDSFNNMMS